MVRPAADVTDMARQPEAHAGDVQGLKFRQAFARLFVLNEVDEAWEVCGIAQGETFFRRPRDGPRHGLADTPCRRSGRVGSLNQCYTETLQDAA